MITEEQKKFKKGKLGTSQVGPALGVSRWTTKLKLYHEILGTIEHEGPDEERMLIGNLIEPTIREIYTHRTGLEVIEKPETIVHPRHPWMIAHYDGETVDDKEDRLIEIKNVGFHMYTKWGEDGDPMGPPLEVQAQVTQQANLAERDRVDVVALFGGNELRVYPMEITKSQKKVVEDGVLDFWTKCIVPRKEPVVTADDIELMKLLYANCQNEEVMIEERTETAVHFMDYRQLKQEIKEKEKKADLYKAEIIKLMGTAGIMMRSGDEEFTHKKTKDTEKTDFEAVCVDVKEHLKANHFWHQIEYLDRFVEDNTKTVPGHRMFLDKGK